MSHASERTSWRGDGRLKASVLDQVAAHHQAGRLQPLTIEGQPVGIYGWSDPFDLEQCSRALGLPQDLLALGFHVFDGFPTDLDGTREHIEDRRRLFDEIPIGRDLSGVARAFVHWLMTDATVGLAATVDDAEVATLLDDIATELACGAIESAPRVAPLLAYWQAEIPAQWAAHARVDARVYHHVRALGVTRYALAMAHDPAQVALLVDTATTGVSVHPSIAGEERTRAQLLGFLQG